MDAEDAGASGEEELTPRFPHRSDLVALCKRLNELGARYIVVGGFAIMAHGMARTTGDMGILMDSDLANEALVFRALEILPDKAVLQLDPGDVAKYIVVRVADEILVDLMKSACGIEYEEAAREIQIIDMDGVGIPFASARLLWRTKAPTRREKDALDLLFLRDYFTSRGEEPPGI